MRSLFLRIFLSLVVAFVLVSLAVFVVAAGSGSIPIALPVIARAVLSGEIQASGDTAVALYKSGGTEALARYFSELKAASGTSEWLMDDTGRDVLGQSVPYSIQQFCSRNFEMGVPFVEIRRSELKAAIRIRRDGKAFLVVASLENPRSTRLRVLLPDILPRYLAGLFAAFAFSFWLARKIAEPVAQLRSSMRQYSGGSSQLQLPSQLLKRRDELGDLSREFKEMQSRIEGLLQRQKQLIADVSHEFRSPLTRLSVAVEIIRDSPAREPELIDRLSREISYLEALIQQLLRLASLKSQPVQSAEPVLLAEVLAVVVENAEFEAVSDQKRIEYLRPPTDLLVLGDDQLLTSAFENIIRNAIRYTDRQTAVRIDASNTLASAAIAVVKISDHGPGVPDSALSKIFQPFYRVGESRDRGGGGVGLGLSIAQRSIALCGGELLANNRPDGGLEIEIRLRCAGR